MRQVLLLPDTRLRTLFHGPKEVGQVQVGERVLGYSYKHRRLQEMTITSKTEVAESLGARLMITSLGFIELCADTAVLDVKANECLVSTLPQKLLGTCGINPKQIVIRDVQAVSNRAFQPAVQLTWDEPDETYLWAEGLLVGTNADGGDSPIQD